MIQVKLEILMTCGSKSWGGLEMMALDSAMQLKKYGFTVYFISPEGSELHYHAKNNNIDMITYQYDAGTIGKIKILKKFLSENNIRIIHTHLSHDLWFIVPALKISHSDSGLFLTKHVASGVSKKDIFHKYLYGRVNKIFAISNFIKRNVIETCPVQEDKVILLHNGINPDVYNKTKYDRNEIKNELNIDADKIVIGLIGRITPGKGHFEFINSAEIINRKYPGKCVFLVTGSASKGEENIESDLKLTAKGKKISNIIFTGFRSDVQRILSCLDILAFPSHDESFGITLLEAMAMEVPVVACSSSGVPDIIPSDDYGILIPPRNYEALADAIVKMIDNADLRKSLAKNSRKRVEEYFDAAKLTSDLINHYDI